MSVPMKCKHGFPNKKVMNGFFGHQNKKRRNHIPVLPSIKQIISRRIPIKRTFFFKFWIERVSFNGEAEKKLYLPRVSGFNAAKSN